MPPSISVLFYGWTSLRAIVVDKHTRIGNMKYVGYMHFNVVDAVNSSAGADRCNLSVPAIVTQPLANL